MSGIRLAAGGAAAWLAIATLVTFMVSGYWPLLPGGLLLGGVAFAALASFDDPVSRFFFVIIAAPFVGLLMHGVVHADPYVAGYVLYFIAAAGIALAVTRGRMSPFAISALLLAFVAWVTLQVLQGTPPNDVLAVRSRNHISVVAIGLACMAMLVDRRFGKPLPIWPACAAFVASVLALGRAGIIASGLLLLGTLWVRRATLTLRTVAVGFGGVALAIVGVTAVGTGFQDLELVFTAFQFEFQRRGVQSQVRADILERYLDSLHGMSYVVGHSRQWVDSFRYTLHNSYLAWHHFYGACALLLAIQIARGFGRAVLRHREMALIMAAVGLRSLTDTVLFPGLFFDAVMLTALAMATFEVEAGEAEPSPAERAATPDGVT